MVKLVCESLQTMYSIHFLSVESFYFWSVYGMFEQQRLISDFADDQDTPFLLEAARMYYLVPVCRSGTELENVFMKHYAPNHMLAPKKGSSQKGVQLKP